jgi:hypothetical protein
MLTWIKDDIEADKACAKHPGRSAGWSRSGTAPAACKSANYGARKLMKSLHLRQAAPCDLRQRRTSERTGQRFTPVGQTSIGSRYARNVDFEWLADGILMECRN